MPRCLSAQAARSQVHPAWHLKTHTPHPTSFPGVFGDLQRGVAEIGWANLYVMEQRRDILEFTDWYLVEPTCVYMRRPTPHSGIYMYLLLLPLDRTVWLSGLAALLSVAAFYSLQSCLWKDWAGTTSLYSLVLFGVSVTFSHSSDFAHRQQPRGLRLASIYT